MPNVTERREGGGMVGGREGSRERERERELAKFCVMNITPMGWRYGSMVKRNSCCSREPRFDFQHACGHSHCL